MRDGGYIHLYEITNTAKPGMRPKEGLKEHDKAFYSLTEKSYLQFYGDEGTNGRVDRVVRCWNTDWEDARGMVAVMDGDTHQYIVTNTRVNPNVGCTDLSLVRSEKAYEVTG